MCVRSHYQVSTSSWYLLLFVSQHLHLAYNFSPNRACPGLENALAACAYYVTWGTSKFVMPFWVGVANTIKPGAPIT